MVKKHIQQLISKRDLTRFHSVHDRKNQQNAVRFSSEKHDQLATAAHLLKYGHIGVIAFNGVYGIFTNAESQAANERILTIKQRPNDKKLVMVAAPEYLPEHIDFSKVPYSHEQIVALQRSLHALGVILPAGKTTPAHLISRQDEQQTVVSIWTEYPPLRTLLETFRVLGGRALAGTSANRSGKPTHHDSNEAWQDFKSDVDFFVEADFTTLPAVRKRSTSILDLTRPRPRLHRLGNVTQEEIQEALLKHKFPDLQVNDERVIVVQPRK